MAQNPGHNASLQRIVGRSRNDSPPAPRRIVSQEFFKAHGDVVFLIFRMGAEDANVLTSGFSQTQVEGEGGCSFLVGHYSYSTFSGGDSLQGFPGAILGVPIDGQNFQVEIWSLLVEKRSNALLDGARFLVYSQNHRNERAFVGRIFLHQGLLGLGLQKSDSRVVSDSGWNLASRLAGR